jgi:hypothetical protein
LPEDALELIRKIERDLLDLAARVNLEDERIHYDIKNLHDEVGRLKESVGGMITEDRFKPVEKIVLGGAALVLISVFTAILAIVIRSS